jgi:predicted ATP-grasp superfamily ATP-dependent carboligase
MKDRAMIIFSGFNQRAILAFCRVAEKYAIPYYIVAKSSDDTIFQTNYRNKVISVRSMVQLDLRDFLQQIKKVQEITDYTEYVILPSSEALNRFILSHRFQFLAIRCTIPLVDEDLYRLISDKFLFGELCKKHGITVPGQIDNPGEDQFPLVAKPKRYYSQQGAALYPHILQSKKDWDQFRCGNDMQDFYFQEFIGGASYYLLYYFTKDGHSIAFSQQNLAQQPEGKSILAAIPADIHITDVSKLFVKLFQTINFHGLVMVEVKYFNERYYMIEANPRLWGPSQLFVDCGVPIFETFLTDWGFDCHYSTGIDLKSDICYFWFGGLLQSVAEHGSIVFHDFSIKMLTEKLAQFMKNDIYLRDDTIYLYNAEIKNIKLGGTNAFKG